MLLGRDEEAPVILLIFSFLLDGGYMGCSLCGNSLSWKFIFRLSLRSLFKPKWFLMC